MPDMIGISEVTTPSRKKRKERGRSFQLVFEDDIRKLKAIITLIIYGLLFMLLKIIYDRFIQFPDISNVGIIVFLTFLLVLIVLMLNHFSRKLLQRITYFTSELDSARKYAETVVDSVQIPLAVLDREGRIRSVNRAYLAQFRMEGEQLGGQDFFDLAAGRFRIPDLTEYVRSETKDKPLRDLETTVEWPRDVSRMYLINGRNFRQGDLESVLLSIEDITTRKLAEDNLRLYAAKIEEASNAKSDFLTSVSHELRTPLTAIIGFSEILQEQYSGSLSDKQREYIHDIHHSGKHLLALIDDLLDMSKIEAGKMTLELQDTDLESLMTESLAVVRDSAAGKRILIATEIAEGLGHCRVDPRKLTQILFNLLSNAVKFTPEGGRIVLGAAKVTSEDVSKSPLLEVRVSDSGIGIAREELPKLFTPFHQIASSQGHHTRGTGLGLSLVKRLVELHGGNVSVDSEPGAGSCFSFRIPYQ